MNPSTVALIALCFAGLTFLFGGGALASYLKSSKDSSSKHAVLEYRLEETTKKVEEHTKELGALKSGLALTDQNIGQIKDSLKKLDLLETVTSQMSQLMERTANILPRSEADLRFNELGRRVHDVEETVKEITHPS